MDWGFLLRLCGPTTSCHCEERSDEAISLFCAVVWPDLFVQVGSLESVFSYMETRFASKSGHTPYALMRRRQLPFLGILQHFA